MVSNKLCFLLLAFVILMASMDTGAEAKFRRKSKTKGKTGGSSKSFGSFFSSGSSGKTKHKTTVHHDSAPVTKTHVTHQHTANTAGHSTVHQQSHYPVQQPHYGSYPVQQPHYGSYPGQQQPVHVIHTNNIHHTPSQNIIVAQPIGYTSHHIRHHHHHSSTTPRQYRPTCHKVKVHQPDPKNATNTIELQREECTYPVACYKEKVQQVDPNNSTNIMEVEQEICRPAPNTSHSSVANGRKVCNQVKIHQTDANNSTNTITLDREECTYLVACYKEKVNEPDPKNSTNIIEVEKEICRPAPKGGYRSAASGLSYSGVGFITAFLLLFALQN